MTASDTYMRSYGQRATWAEGTWHGTQLGGALTDGVSGFRPNTCGSKIKWTVYFTDWSTLGADGHSLHIKEAS